MGSDSIEKPIQCNAYVQSSLTPLVHTVSSANKGAVYFFLIADVRNEYTVPLFLSLYSRSRTTAAYAVFESSGADGGFGLFRGLCARVFGD
ncbi:MAG: hypothetical protein ACI9BW_001808 [Gammaproteobacteria bacterium]|jgi:hypothetical protein